MTVAETAGVKAKKRSDGQDSDPFSPRVSCIFLGVSVLPVMIVQHLEFFFDLGISVVFWGGHGEGTNSFWRRGAKALGSNLKARIRIFVARTGVWAKLQ
jgi:hypothetical protein